MGSDRKIVNKFVYSDSPIGFGLHSIQFFLIENNVLILSDLVALDHLIPRNKFSSFVQKRSYLKVAPSVLCRKWKNLFRGDEVVKGYEVR